MSFLIQPQDFVSEMENHWTENLGNSSSKPLRQVWDLLAATFGCHVDAYGCQAEDNKQTWSVLQPECGTGKSQGTVIYCKMLSELPIEQHCGVLIVTRLTEDCDSMAKQINELSGKTQAISFHSKNDVTVDELKDYPVLVITHKAYELALDSVKTFNQINSAFDRFLEWNDSERKLVVIDEALDIIDEVQISLDNIRDTLGAIPEVIRKECPKEIKAMEAAIALIENHKKSSGSSEFIKDKKEVFKYFSDKDGLIVDFKKLKRHLSKIDFIKGRKDDKEQLRVRLIHSKRLDDLSKLVKGWIYYANTSRKETLNHARLIVPENIQGAVILDATANANLTYRLFGVYPYKPLGARSYENVTLNIARGHITGKRKLTDYRNRQQHVHELMTWMIETIPEDSKVFVCTHKDLEPLIEIYETPFEVLTGHWFAIDGSNSYQDCDVGIYFGLPWIPNTKPVNTFCALQGVVDDGWLHHKQRQWEEFEDIKESLKVSNMAVSIIQAFNRPRCRKVIDSKGNCKKTDLYIWLNDNQKFNESLLQSIQQEMPKINLKDFTYSHIKNKRLKKGKTEEGLVKFSEGMSLGKYSASDVKKSMGFTQGQWDKLVGKVKDTTSDLYKKLSELNIKYITERHGSRNIAYLVKS